MRQCLLSKMPSGASYFGKHRGVRAAPVYRDARKAGNAAVEVQTRKPSEIKAKIPMRPKWYRYATKTLNKQRTDCGKSAWQKKSEFGELHSRGLGQTQTFERAYRESAAMAASQRVRSRSW